ncbi:hypothetical protein NCS52_01003800 [Fusarium sp. LHS14.1]|nr:hypothetical protein NCS52_01003800 [Fusarium sp. LHS14.1]
MPGDRTAAPKRLQDKGPRRSQPTENPPSRAGYASDSPDAPPSQRRVGHASGPTDALPGQNSAGHASGFDSRSGPSTASTVRRATPPTAPQASDLINAQIQSQLEQLVAQRMSQMRSQIVAQVMSDMRSQLEELVDQRMGQIRSQVVAEVVAEMRNHMVAEVMAEMKSQMVAEVVAHFEARQGDESARESVLSRRRRYQLPEPEQDSGGEGHGGLDGDSDALMTEPTPDPRDDPRSPSDPLEEDVGILLGPTPTS